MNAKSIFLCTAACLLGLQVAFSQAALPKPDVRHENSPVNRHHYGTAVDALIDQILELRLGRFSAREIYTEREWFDIPQGQELAPIDHALLTGQIGAVPENILHSERMKHYRWERSVQGKNFFSHAILNGTAAFLITDDDLKNPQAIWERNLDGEMLAYTLIREHRLGAMPSSLFQATHNRFWLNAEANGRLLIDWIILEDQYRDFFHPDNWKHKLIAMDELRQKILNRYKTLPPEQRPRGVMLQNTIKNLRQKASEITRGKSAAYSNKDNRTSLRESGYTLREWLGVAQNLLTEDDYTYPVERVWTQDIGNTTLAARIVLDNLIGRIPPELMRATPHNFWMEEKIDDRPLVDIMISNKQFSSFFNPKNWVGNTDGMKAVFDFIKDRYAELVPDSRISSAHVQYKFDNLYNGAQRLTNQKQSREEKRNKRETELSASLAAPILS